MPKLLSIMTLSLQSWSRILPHSKVLATGFIAVGPLERQYNDRVNIESSLKCCTQNLDVAGVEGSGI